VSRCWLVEMSVRNVSRVSSLWCYLSMELVIIILSVCSVIGMVLLNRLIELGRLRMVMSVVKDVIRVRLWEGDWCVIMV